MRTFTLSSGKINWDVVFSPGRCLPRNFNLDHLASDEGVWSVNRTLERVREQAARLREEQTS